MAHTHWSILVDEITTLRLIAKSSELLTTTMATYTVPCLGGGGWTLAKHNMKNTKRNWNNVLRTHNRVVPLLHIIVQAPIMSKGTRE